MRWNAKPSDFLPGTPLYDLKGHLKYIQRLHAQYPLNNDEACTDHVVKLAQRITTRMPHAIVHALLGTIKEILTDEDIYCPNVPTLEYQPYLTRLQTVFTRNPKETEDVIVNVFREILASAPESIYEETKGALKVPLSDIAPTKQLVTNISYRFTSSGLFPTTSYHLAETAQAISGIDPDAKTKKKYITPMEYDGDATDYLRRTPLQALLQVPVPISLPSRDRWPSHAIILAPSEWGKSQLIGHYLREAIEDPDPIPLFLLDPHGDLYRDALSRVPPERLIAIDPDTNPPDLNILDYGVLSDREALNTFQFLMSSLAGGLSPKQEQCIPPLFALLRKIPGANLSTLHEIITDTPKKGAPSAFAEPIKELDTVYRKFFETLFFTGNFQETKDALQWKLMAALGEPAFKKMFSAEKNSIDIDRFIGDGRPPSERKIVLVKGGEKSLGKEGMRLFFLFLVGQYYAAGKRRDAIPEKDRHLAMMFVDEAHVVLQSPVIEDVCTELRKYKCAFVPATQLWAQVAQEVKPAILGSCGTKIVGRLQHDEANVLARDMFATPDMIRGLNATPRSHAEWCFFVNSQTPRAMVVTVPYGRLQGMPKRNHIVNADKIVPPVTPITAQATGQVTPPPVQKTAKVDTPQSDIELVITTARRLETLLQKHYSATGQGMHQKIDSVENKLPPRMVYCGRYIATLRNKVIHEDFTLPDPVRFVRYSEEFERLSTEMQKATRSQEPPSGSIPKGPPNAEPSAPLPVVDDDMHTKPMKGA